MKKIRVKTQNDMCPDFFVNFNRGKREFPSKMTRKLGKSKREGGGGKSFIIQIIQNKMTRKLGERKRKGEGRKG